MEIEIYALNDRFRIAIKREPELIGKAVLPTIFFVNTNHPEFADERQAGFMIIFSWWDFSIRFGLFF